jgi:hypothetical protein
MEQQKYTDMVYEIMDELNAAIEEIVEEHSENEDLEVIVMHLQTKVKEFIYDFQQDIEKLSLIGIE